MSNLLKSKFLLGLMVVAIVLVGAFAFMSTASAADCTITKTLKYGMKGADVTCLQQQLAITPATGYFGKLTKAAVMAFQTNHGLKADGVFGAASRAALASGSTGGTTYPAGCTSNTGFSTTTGLPCSGSTNLPAGCTTTSGYSSTTGLPCSGGTTTTTTQSGPLTVSLASDNPAGGTVVAGQATADLAHFTFTGTGTLSSVTLTKTGISDQNTLSNVYLYDGVTRLTDGYSFNNAGTLTINGLNVAVAGSKTLSVRADVSSGTTSYSVGVSLTGYAVTGGTTNSVSVAGNVMYVASAPSTLGSAAFNTNNSVTAAGVNPGTTGYPIWSTSLQINNRALQLKSINFRVIGSAPADALANVKMYLDGTAIGSAGVATTINGSNYWAFDLSAAPVALNTGSHTLDLRADIVKGSSFKFTASLQQASDMMLYDSQVGVNVAVTGITSARTTAGEITINSGTVSAAIDPTFQSQTTVTGGATNVTIAKFKLHGYGEDVKMSALNFLPYTSTGNGLQNVTAYFNGSQIGTQTANWTATSVVALTPGSQMIVPAGVDSYLEIKADLRTTAGVNYTTGSVYATLQSSTGEGMNSKSSVTVASGGVQGNSLSIQTGVLALASNTGFTSQTISPNTANQKIGSYVLQNQSSSESVRVTNLQVNLTLTTADATNYSNLKTSETSGSGATPINPATAVANVSTNNFSVDFTIAPGTTKTIDVFADIGSVTSAAVQTKLFVTALGSLSNVTLCSPTLTSGTQNGCNNGSNNPLAGQTMTIAIGTFGTPAVVVSGTDTSRFVAGGTTTGVTNAATAQFKFTAANGSATITKLKFVDAAANSTVTSVAVGSVSAPMVSNVAYLTGLNIPVPQGGAGVTIDTKMSYSPVFGAITSGLTSNMQLSYVEYTMGGTTKTICKAADSCTSSWGSTDIDSGQTMTLVGSKPTVTVAQPAGVVLAVGSVEAIDVTIAADTAGPISITSFPITASLSGSNSGQVFATGSTNPFIVKDASNNTITLSTQSSASFFTSTAGGTNIAVTFAAPYTLSAGQSQTFKVFLPVAALSTGTLPNTYMYTNLGTGTNFVWTDVAGNAGSTQTGTTLIYNYPNTFTSSIHN